ncbi:hypothetical protein Hanom_Chr14g01321421 [Helianthus anomalus]
MTQIHLCSRDFLRKWSITWPHLALQHCCLSSHLVDVEFSSSFSQQLLQRGSVLDASLVPVETQEEHLKQRTPRHFVPVIFQHQIIFYDIASTASTRYVCQQTMYNK